MNWKQELVDAQLSVNRSVFEMNKPGRVVPEDIRPDYIIKEIESALENLQNSLSLLKKESEPEWKKKMKKEFMSNAVKHI